MFYKKFWIRASSPVPPGFQDQARPIMVWESCSVFKERSYIYWALNVKYCARYFYIFISLTNKYILYTYFIETTMLWSIYYCLHFTDEETFPRRLRNLLAQVHQLERGQAGLKSRSYNLKVHARLGVLSPSPGFTSPLPHPDKQGSQCQSWQGP